MLSMIFSNQPLSNTTFFILFFYLQNKSLKNKLLSGNKLCDVHAEEVSLLNHTAEQWALGGRKMVIIQLDCIGAQVFID